MASITWADVTADEASLTGYSLAGQIDILAYVNAYFNKARIGAEDSIRLRMARIYLARHEALTRPSSPGGPLIARSEDSLSQAFASGAAVNPNWQASGWGRALAQLLAATPARAGVLLGGCV